MSQIFHLLVVAVLILLSGPSVNAIDFYIDRNRGGSGPLLGECAADCDDDGECEGDLICWQRGEGDYDHGSDCTGDLSVLDTSGYPGWDYCISLNSASASSHLIVPGAKGEAGGASYCVDDTSNEGPVDLYFGKSIVVSCCALDGSAGYRPDCNAYPRTYEEAVQVCDSYGYRLCTEDELTNGFSKYHNNNDGITHGEGCSFDYALNWASDCCSDSCSSETDTSEPTSDPTISPTVDPTTSPTVDPTTSTTSPTFEPTVQPTTVGPTAAPTCDGQGLTAVNWHTLFHSGSDQGSTLLDGYSVTWDAQSFSLTFAATLQYVGLSADGYNDDAFNLGTTYWVDLQSFEGSADQINQAGSCGNRRSADYEGVAFADWWSYPADVTGLESVATGQRTAYPPSDWSLSALDCTTVKYQRTLSLTALSGCTDASGQALVEKTESAAVIAFSGSFFVEMVSPFTMASTDYYRVYPLVQHEFSVELSRTIDTLASTGVKLIVSSVMGFNHDDAGDYVLRVLAQSADYISLNAPNVVSTPDGVTVGVLEEETSDCIDASFLCLQVFKLTIPSAIDCSSASSSTSIDFGGTYQMAFTPQCRQSGDAACSTFMSALPDSGQVALDVAWDFVDETCGVDLFAAQFASTLTFYKDDQFAEPVADGDVFEIARDTVYGQIVVTVPTDDGNNDALYNVLDVSIEKVYVCTSSSPQDLESSLAAADSIGGCLATASVDSDGPYLVIGDGADSQYGGTTLSAAGNNDARFSFTAFDAPRTTISVHVQLLLTLQTPSGRRRRRLLEDVEVVADPNQIRHFVGTTFIAQVRGGSDASNVTVDGDVSFYGDAAFDELVLDESAAFSIGDPIYGQIAVEIADDPSSELLSVAAVRIETVYVCTSSDPEGLSIAEDDEYAVGGCFSTTVDPESPYLVIGHGASMQFGGSVLDGTVSNEARFSFVAFDTPRDVISVHVEVMVTVDTASGDQLRRRLMVEKTHHFLGTTRIESSVAAGATTFGDNTETMMMAGIGGVAVIAMVVFVSMMMVKRRKGHSKESNLAEHVPEMSPSSLPATTSGALEV